LIETSDLLAVARTAAERAGVILMERFGGPASGVATKSSAADLVSDADRDAEAAILATIRDARPNDGILAEEGGRADGADYRWVVDPLDGTVNFLFGIPHWCVSIACEDHVGALVGVVHDPSRAETFCAVRGAGATLNDRPLALTPSDDLSTALAATGFSYDPRERERQGATIAQLFPMLRDIRRFGAAALDLAWVAAGRIDAFFEADLAPWDLAAGALIASEAGGELIELPPGPDGHTGLIASRPGLSGPLDTLLRKVGAG
jgi:myo-inositol-1(or 4)-monophosphatase